MKMIRVVASENRVVPLEDGSKVGSDPVSVRSSHYVRQLIACGALVEHPEELALAQAAVFVPAPNAPPPALPEGATASDADVPPRATTLQQGIEDAVRSGVSPTPRNTTTRNKA